VIKFWLHSTLTFDLKSCNPHFVLLLDTVYHHHHHHYYARHRHIIQLMTGGGRGHRGQLPSPLSSMLKPPLIDPRSLAKNVTLTHGKRTHDSCAVDDYRSRSEKRDTACRLCAVHTAYLLTHSRTKHLLSGLTREDQCVTIVAVSHADAIGERSRCRYGDRRPIYPSDDTLLLLPLSIR